MNPNFTSIPDSSDQSDEDDLTHLYRVLDGLGRQVAEAKKSISSIDATALGALDQADYAQEQLHLSRLAVDALAALAEHSAENLRVSENAIQALSHRVDVVEEKMHASELVQDALRKINASSKVNLEVSQAALMALNKHNEQDETKLQLSELAVTALKKLNQTSSENLQVSEGALKTLADQLSVQQENLQARELAKWILIRLEEVTQEAIRAGGLTYQAVTKLAFYDSLTNLPNRRLQSERIHRSIISSKRLGHWDAVLFLDLDKFKILNDRYGHSVGDQLLIIVAQRLTLIVREMDTVSRYGGDEFTILLNGFSGDRKQALEAVKSIAEKIRVALAQPYILDVINKDGASVKIQYQCFTSIGVALFSGDQADADLILDCADEAMYEAKHKGGNRVHFYDPIAFAQITLKNLYGLATAHDIETASHGIEMQHFVQALAVRLQKMGLYPEALSDDNIELMVEATPLHDIGKTKIPMSILHKEGPLTPDEREIVRTHTTESESILSDARKRNASLDRLLDMAIAVAMEHHECWDGSGYPRGLKGDDISLAGRIVAVADVYDALVNMRSYKVAMSHEQAVKEILKGKGSRFDPLVVEAFMLEKEQFKSILEGDLVALLPKSTSI